MCRHYSHSTKKRKEEEENNTKNSNFLKNLLVDCWFDKFIFSFKNLFSKMNTVVVGSPVKQNGHEGNHYRYLNLEQRQQQQSPSSKEKQDRMIAAEVMTSKFSFFLPKTEKQQSKKINKHESDSNNNSHSNNNSSSGVTGSWNSSSGGSNKVKKEFVMITTTDLTISDANTATNATEINTVFLNRTLGLPLDRQKQGSSFYPVSTSTFSSSSVALETPFSVDENEKAVTIPKQQPLTKKREVSPPPKYENNSIASSSSSAAKDGFVSSNDKLSEGNSPDEEEMVIKMDQQKRQQPLLREEEKHCKEVEKCTKENNPILPKNNNPNGEQYNNRFHVHNNKDQTTTTVTPKNVTQRKKNLPVLNERILKELFGSTNNRGLVYLIHPFNDNNNDNFLVRSINKKDLTNTLQSLSEETINTNNLFEPRVNNHSNSTAKPIWIVIKKNRKAIQFLGTTTPTPKVKKDLNNIFIERSTKNKNSTGNQEPKKDLLTKSVSNNTVLEVPPSLSGHTTDKLATSSSSNLALPLKKRKVADSLFEDSSSTSSSSITSEDFCDNKSTKSVSKITENFIKDRSIFIVFPSDLPKIVQRTSSNHKNESTNLELCKNIEFSLHQDEDGDLPLHIASVHKDLKMVTLYGMLIQRAGKSVDRFNKKKLTPLHLCVKVKFIAGLKKLIEMGANVNRLDGNGQSALHIAVSNSDHKSLNSMLEECSKFVKDSKMKPNLNNHDYEGLTPLHTAVNNNDLNMIKTLLQKGAELNTIDFKSGRTPLFYAVENNNFEIAKFLLANDASVDFPNFAGNTAFLSAVARGYNDISKLLAENGADTKGLLAPEETIPLSKITSSVKSQLKNKLVSNKNLQILQES